MKKLLALVLAAALVFSFSGCSQKGEDDFPGIDSTIRDDLLNFLMSAALGGRGNYVVNVDGEVGHGSVGDVTGSVSGPSATGEIVSISFFNNTQIEVGRGEVGPDGKWGPVTVLHGPKALVLMEENEVLGYWLAPQVFAMAPLSQASNYNDFVISPKESGLVALALIHSGEYQAAADLLAVMRAVHLEHSGLPRRADVFGLTQATNIDASATAWAGYAAAALAKSTNSLALWEEAKSYALYLRDIDVPADSEARLAGWLMFSEVKEKYPEFGYLPKKWQPEAGPEYDPWLGTWMLLSGEGNLAEYIDLTYQPVSPALKWVHYNLLAALEQLPEEVNLDDLGVVPGGKAIMVNNRASLEATSWMLLSLTGKIRD